MKTILFFSRKRLLHLYAKMDNKLKNDYNIVHVAYSSVEAKILLDTYNINSQYIMKEYVKNYDISCIDANLTYELDQFIIHKTNGRFNLNSAIQSDRGFIYLSQDEAYDLALIYFDFWKNIFFEGKVDYFFHETTSLLFNFIASLFCIENKAIYSDLVEVPFYKNAFIFISSNNGSCIDFVKNFKHNNIDNTNEILKLENYFEKKYISIANFHIKSSLDILLFHAISQELKIMINKITKKYDRFKDNTEYFMLNDRKYFNKMKNIIMYKFIEWDIPNYSESYYYYSMNLEPEAVVQYLADGLYTNQVKLIQNIASQLPPNSHLYVKDHIVEYGYRDYSDYMKLKQLHNVKLIHPTVRGSTLIKNAKAVIAICGTAILEAMIFKKTSYIFGNFYYTLSKNVFYVKNIKELRQLLYSQPVFSSDDYKLFLSSYLKSVYIGSVSSYTTGIEDLSTDSDNFDLIANAIDKFIKNNKNE